MKVRRVAGRRPVDNQRANVESSALPIKILHAVIGNTGYLLRSMALTAFILGAAVSASYLFDTTVSLWVLEIAPPPPPPSC